MSTVLIENQTYEQVRKFIANINLDPTVLVNFITSPALSLFVAAEDRVLRFEKTTLVVHLLGDSKPFAVVTMDFSHELLCELIAELGKPETNNGVQVNIQQL